MKKFILIFLLSFLSYGQEKLALQKDGIKVYTSAKDSTKLKQYRAEMVFEVCIDSVKNKILDVPNLKKWNYKTTLTKLVKKMNDSTSIVYMVNDLGWPLKDRDNVAKIVLMKFKNGFKIAISPANTIYREFEDKIRVKKFYGEWILEKITTKKTKVTQKFYADPGGDLPSFLVNVLVTKAPFETFIALRKQFQN